MIFTLQYAIDNFGKQVDSGTCNPTRIAVRTNEAIQTLLTIADWKLTARRVKIFTCNNIVTLPHTIEKLITVTIGHQPALIFSQHYEFLEGGPGRIDGCQDTCARDLADLGAGHALLFDIPCEFEPLRVFAMSTSSDDTSSTIMIKGVDTSNNQIITDGVPGESIAINRWTEGTEGRMPSVSALSMSANTYKNIDQMIKPVTKGYVTLYAYNPDWTEGADGDPMLYLLGKYGPDETHPGYRRYRILNTSCCGNYIIGLAKLAYVPAKYANDPLLIQSMPAIKFMLKALNFYDQDKETKGRNYESLAINALRRQTNNSDQDSNEVQINTDGFSLGAVTGLIA